MTFSEDDIALFKSPKYRIDTNDFRGWLHIDNSARVENKQEKYEFTAGVSKVESYIDMFKHTAFGTNSEESEK